MSDDLVNRAAAFVEKQKAWDKWDNPRQPAPPAIVEGEVANLVSDMAAEITRLRALVAETGALAARRAEVIEIQASVMEKQATEITRLRALCDSQSKDLSLSAMRHGRRLVGLERRNARQRRALAKLYQRRHDKNAALATARREGMEEAAKWHDEQAARAQKLADMKVSALDAKVWGDYAENHREYAAEIRAGAKEEK